MSECTIPAFYSWSEPVARKPYWCCECQAKINTGEQYFKATGKWDGELQTFRQHLLCSSACMMIRDDYNDAECIGFGELFDWFGEARQQLDRGDPLRDQIAKIKWRQRLDNRAAKSYDS